MFLALFYCTKATQTTSLAAFLHYWPHIYRITGCISRRHICLHRSCIVGSVSASHYRHHKIKIPTSKEAGISI